MSSPQSNDLGGDGKQSTSPKGNPAGMAVGIMIGIVIGAALLIGLAVVTFFFVVATKSGIHNAGGTAGLGKVATITEQQAQYSPSSDVTPITGQIELNPLTFTFTGFRCIDQIGDDHPSTGGTYLIVYFTAKNTGREPFQYLSDHIVITTDDHRQFAGDSFRTSSQASRENLVYRIEVPPGLSKDCLAVIEFPDDDFAHHPILHVGKVEEYDGTVPLLAGGQEGTDAAVMQTDDKLGPQAGVAGTAGMPAFKPLREEDALAKPSKFCFTGDGSGNMEQVVWAEWDAKQAIGQGVLVANDCQPDCASGKLHRFPAKVVLSAPHRTQQGYLFTSMQIDSPDSPGGSEHYDIPQ